MNSQHCLAFGKLLGFKVWIRHKKGCPMRSYHIVLPVALVMLALVMLDHGAVAFGQTRNGQPSGNQPGIWHGDKFLGFVPAHEQRKARVQSSPSPPTTSAEPTEASQAAQDNSVAAVAYQEPYISDPPLPPGIDVMPIDDFGMSKFGHADFRGDSCYWGRAEYLLWWTQGMNVPALASTSPLGTLQAQAGVLGQPGSSVVFGNSDLADQARSGGRFTLGTWLDPERSHGIEANYLVLGGETESFHAGLNDFDILARPFLNAQTGLEDSRLIAFPGLVQGTLDIAATTEFQSFELLYRQQVGGSWGCHLDILVGYRYATLDDRLRISESTAALTGPPAGTTFDLFDQFDTETRFHGAEFGIAGSWRINECWSWDALAKLAIGDTSHRAVVSGQTITTSAVGVPTTALGGLLTQSSNLGSFRWDDFSSISEFGVTLRRDLQCGLALTFGYSFIYWSDVARAGEQVDRSVNPSQIPPGNLTGSARPSFPERTNDFWAQGLRFGLEYDF